MMLTPLTRISTQIKKIRHHGFYLVHNHRNHSRIRCRQTHALAHSVSSARPAGVYKVNVRTVLAYLLAQKFGVHARAKRQERRTEAGGEGANGVGNAAFRARNFARVARNEVVHCLLVGKFANGRQHAVSVGGKEDNGVGVSAHAGYNGVGYKVYGVLLSV